MKLKKISRSVLVSLLISSMSMPVIYGGVPAVSTDEAVYVNLDYYGNQSDISIVKSCSLNGNKEFIDYGSYEDVINMTNLVSPVITEEGVSWVFDEISENRFYFQCKPKEDIVVLPWNFDISYKLNGVPKKAEELAGASGLVEINIDAKANKDAKEYYKNNMILQVAMMVNMQDNLSVEAPGSQLQSMGTYKAVIFAAVPGEDKTFTVRIGTESFESLGITMLMVPATLDQIDDIRELKESKDKIEDAGDAVYDALNSILSTLENTTEGLRKTQEGLNTLDDGREIISNDKGIMHDFANASIGSLSQITQDINNLIPHIQKGQSLVKNINSDVNKLVDSVTNLSPILDEYYNSISELQNDINAIKDSLEDAHENYNRRNELLELLEARLDGLAYHMGVLSNTSVDMNGSLEDLNSSKGDIGNIIQNIGNINSAVGGAASEGSGGSLDAVLGSVNNSLNSINGSTSNLLGKTDDLISNTTDTLNSLNNTISSGQRLVTTLSSLTSIIRDYFKILDENYPDNIDMLEQLNNIGSITQKAIDESKEVIDYTDRLRTTTLSYEEGTTELLNDTEKLTTSMTEGLMNLLAFLSSAESTIRKSGEKIDEGTKQTIDGLMDVLENGIKGIGETNYIKTANDTIKQTIDNELDRFETETNMLYMDNTLPLPSFTSDKNQTPESIQIILRTDEISIDDEKDNITDLEQKPEDIGIWERIKQVFNKIIDSIKGIFQ